MLRADGGSGFHADSADWADFLILRMVTFAFDDALVVGTWHAESTEKVIECDILTNHWRLVGVLEAFSTIFAL